MSCYSWYDSREGGGRRMLVRVTRRRALGWVLPTVHRDPWGLGGFVLCMSQWPRMGLWVHRAAV